MEDIGRPYAFGDFRLDPAILEHRGTLVPLAPKALDLLYLLVSRAPAMVTKEEIFDAVWPGTFVVESSLARNVSVIRKALEERAAGPFIETIPKRGYRFVAPLEQVGGGEAKAPAPTEAIPAAPSDPSSAPWSRNRRITAIALTGMAAIALAAMLWILRPPPPEVDQADERIAQHLVSKVTPAELRKAIAYFEKAVKEHPSSASAHAGLAKALALLPGFGAGGQPELLRAREEAQVALRLDGNHPAALLALGITQGVTDWDFAGSERSLRRAIAADPRRADAYFALSQLLSFNGRAGESLDLMERARRLDPVSPLLGTQYGRLLYNQRQFERAATELRAVLEREPHFTLAHYYLGLTYGFLGRYGDADRHLSAAELNEDVLKTDRAWLSLQRGDPKPARDRYAEVRRMVENGQVGPTSTLLLAVALGDFDEALSGLEKGLPSRDGAILVVHSDPRLEPLRGDPRYRAFRERAGLAR
jgi:DNA-binding winged helix-turn-helix (wHTH) protein/tetratricopeptide (TPR) repeat protein